MNDEQIRIAVAAEVCGWSNYPNDLNACHKMEKTLTKSEQSSYADQVGNLLDESITESLQDSDVVFLVMTATARQRCEAFLRVKGKWLNQTPNVAQGERE